MSLVHSQFWFKCVLLVSIGRFHRVEVVGGQLFVFSEVSQISEIVKEYELFKKFLEPSNKN